MASLTSLLGKSKTILPSRKATMRVKQARAMSTWCRLQIRVALRAAWEALGQFNLQDKLYARVDRLSGGERQRCGMARALVSNAEVFLVDEPLSALDPTLALQTIHVLLAEATERNATLICSLHQVEIARACFTRIVALRDGQIVFDLPGAKVSDAMIAALYRNKADHAPQFEAVETNLDAARPLC